MYLYRLFPVLESVSLNYVLVLVVSILVKLNSVIFLNLVEIVVVQKILSMLFIAKSLQSCPTLCDPIDGSPPGSPVLGSSRQEHWSGLPFLSPMHESEKGKQSRSVVFDLATPRTAAYQAPPSMGFSRQEYWSGVPLPSPTLFIGLM